LPNHCPYPATNHSMTRIFAIYGNPNAIASVEVESGLSGCINYA